MSHQTVCDNCNRRLDNTGLYLHVDTYGPAEYGPNNVDADYCDWNCLLVAAQHRTHPPTDG